MKKIPSVFFLFFALLNGAHGFYKSSGATMPNVLMIDSFDEKRLVNKLGGNIGTWKRDPKDDSQWYEISFDDRNFIGKSGSCLRIDYNIASHMTTYVVKETEVTSPEIGFHAPAFGGIYMQVKNQELGSYKFLVFSIKGDKRIGYTRKIKLEVKDKSRMAAVFVDGITSSWRRFYIPLWQFSPSINIKEIQEIVLVFDQNVTLPKGTLYLDEMYFATEKIAIEDFYAYQELLKPKEEPTAMLEEPKIELPPTPEQIIETEKQEIAQAAQAASLEVKREDENVVVTTHINFETDQSTILDAEVGKLSVVAELIQKHPKFMVEIHGHTDSQGKDRYNYHLSQRRSHAVKDFFEQLEDIDPNHLIPYGWGLRKPVESNDTVEGRAENRRVEFSFSTKMISPVYKLEQPLKIDGSLADWPKFATFELDSISHLEMGNISNAEDLSANVHLQWDENYLYFAARIYDSELLCLKSGRNLYMSDSVELYIDPEGDGLAWSNPKDFQIGFSPSGPSKTPQIWAWFQNKEPNPKEIKYASRVEKDGYTLEAQIAWNFLNPNFVKRLKEEKGTLQWDGIPLNMTVAVHDVDSKDESQEAKLNWHFKKDETVKDRFQLGSLLLIEQ